MAKNLLFTLLFCSLYFAITTPCAGSELTLTKNHILQADECTAPPPDSFRITSIGTNIISLAWNPVWIGAGHTVVVLEKNSAGGWLPLKVIYNLSGTGYTIDSLKSGTQYRVAISTNCVSGGTSERTASKDPITLILDLTIEGRTPTKPTVIGCANVPVGKNWIGYRVDYIADIGSASNTFEFVLDGENVSLKREILDNPIVAVNKAHDWPTCNDPSISGVGSPYKMIRLLPNGTWETIGYVSAIKHFDPPRIEMCPIYIHPVYPPWNGNYLFTALFADNATSHDDCSESSGYTIAPSFNINVQSPFNQTLSIFFSEKSLIPNHITLRLLNTSGRMVLEHKLDNPTPQVSFSTILLPAGIYILQMETEQGVQTVKLIKSM